VTAGQGTQAQLATSHRICGQGATRQLMGGQEKPISHASPTSSTPLPQAAGAEEDEEEEEEETAVP